MLVENKVISIKKINAGEGGPSQDLLGVLIPDFLIRTRLNFEHKQARKLVRVLEGPVCAIKLSRRGAATVMSPVTAAVCVRQDSVA